VRRRYGSALSFSENILGTNTFVLKINFLLSTVLFRSTFSSFVFVFVFRRRRRTLNLHLSISFGKVLTFNICLTLLFYHNIVKINFITYTVKLVHLKLSFFATKFDRKFSKTKKSIYLGPCASNRWFDTGFEHICFVQVNPNRIVGST